MKTKTRSAAPGRLERGATARQKLIEAGLKIYSEVGFKGASTRSLAAAAGVNIAAIPYYFGSKEGLYLAVMDHIIEYYRKNLGGDLDQIRQALDDKKTSPAEYLALLEGYICRLVHFVLQEKSTECAQISIIYTREQMDPTSAFQRLYEGFSTGLRETLEALVATILERDAQSSEVKLITETLLGQVTIFKSSRVTVLKKMGWGTYDEKRMADIARIVTFNIRALMQAHKQKDTTV
ncbi:MAG: CerR family C-terminal domain-containing protein [Desulfocapsaceae bacterium]|nr:CerR family C-terminal domain-containing protein [Desulfocapsaceae bacterium]